MKRTATIGTRAVLVGVPAVFIGVFFFYPVATVLWRGLGGGGGETFFDLARSSRQRDIAWFTLWQAVASTALTLAVGLPAASVVARLPAGRQRLVRRERVSRPGLGRCRDRGLRADEEAHTGQPELAPERCTDASIRDRGRRLTVD